jgi:hypothetical protein
MEDTEENQGEYFINIGPEWLSQKLIRNV